MDKYSDEQLKELYRECAIAKGTEIWKNDLLQTAYNDVFGEDDGYLHYWMVQRLFEKVKEEMAKRFYEQ